MFVDDPPAGWSLPAHLHHATGETIDIFEGEFEMGDRRTATSGAPGDTTHIPPDVVHAASQSPGRRSVIFSPAGKENFFVEAGTSSEDREVDLRTALAAAAAMGWQFIT